MIEAFIGPKCVGNVIKGRRPQLVKESKYSAKYVSELNFKESAFVSPEIITCRYFSEMLFSMGIKFSLNSEKLSLPLGGTYILPKHNLPLNPFPFISREFRACLFIKTPAYIWRLRVPKKDIPKHLLISPCL